MRTTGDNSKNQIFDLGLNRSSVFDDVQLPAYRPQVNVYRDYSIGRSSPVWTVSSAAKHAQRKEHWEKLSEPRKMHPEYQPAKSARPVIRRAALVAVPSERIEELAKASSRTKVTDRDDWTVKPSALNCKPSERVLELSRPRPLPNGYLPCKSATEMWMVSPDARKAIISDRIDDLSKPHIRTVGTNLPRTDAFVVSQSAKKAVASERIVELAQPIVRSN